MWASGNRFLPFHCKQRRFPTVGAIKRNCRTRGVASAAMNADGKIANIASRQYGVFSRRQALKAGFSESAISRRLSNRRWEAIFQGVYRLPGTPDCWHQRLMAAFLWAGAVVSHRSAAEVLRIAGAPKGYIELTVPTGKGLAPRGVVLH